VAGNNGGLYFENRKPTWWSMKNLSCTILVLVTGGPPLALLAAASDEKAAKLQYDEKGQLIPPAD